MQTRSSDKIAAKAAITPARGRGQSTLSINPDYQWFSNEEPFPAQLLNPPCLTSPTDDIKKSSSNSEKEKYLTVTVNNITRYIDFPSPCSEDDDYDDDDEAQESKIETPQTNQTKIAKTFISIPKMSQNNIIQPYEDGTSTTGKPPSREGIDPALLSLQHQSTMQTGQMHLDGAQTNPTTSTPMQHGQMPAGQMQSTPMQPFGQHPTGPASMTPAKTKAPGSKKKDQAPKDNDAIRQPLAKRKNANESDPPILAPAPKRVNINGIVNMAAELMAPIPHGPPPLLPRPPQLALPQMPQMPHATLPQMPQANPPQMPLRVPNDVPMNPPLGHFQTTPFRTNGRVIAPAPQPQMMPGQAGAQHIQQHAQASPQAVNQYFSMQGAIQPNFEPISQEGQNLNLNALVQEKDQQIGELHQRLQHREVTIRAQGAAFNQLQTAFQGQEKMLAVRKAIFNHVHMIIKHWADQAKPVDATTSAATAQEPTSDGDAAGVDAEKRFVEIPLDQLNILLFELERIIGGPGSGNQTA